MTNGFNFWLHFGYFFIIFSVQSNEIQGSRSLSPLHLGAVHLFTIEPLAVASRKPGKLGGLNWVHVLWTKLIEIRPERQKWVNIRKKVDFAPLYTPWPRHFLFSGVIPLFSQLCDEEGFTVIENNFDGLNVHHNRSIDLRGEVLEWVIFYSAIDIILSSVDDRSSVFSLD